MLTEDQLNQLLDADEQGNPENHLAIFSQIHQGRRKRQHAKDKAKQKPLDFADSASVVKALVEVYEKPYSKEESETRSVGADQLLLTLHECMQAGDLTDILYALVRQCRKKRLMLNLAHERVISESPAFEPPPKPAPKPAQAATEVQPTDQPAA